MKKLVCIVGRGWLSDFREVLEITFKSGWVDRQLVQYSFYSVKSTQKDSVILYHSSYCKSAVHLYPLDPHVVIEHNACSSHLIRIKSIHNCTNCCCSLGEVQLIFRWGNSLSGAAKGEGVSLIPQVRLCGSISVRCASVTVRLISTLTTSDAKPVVIIWAASWDTNIDSPPPHLTLSDAAEIGGESKWEAGRQ